MQTVKAEYTRPRFEALLYYVQQSIANFRPDHENVGLRLRMAILKKLMIYLSKRQAEAMYSDRLKVTITEEQALALLDQWLSDTEERSLQTAVSVRLITDEAHKAWM